ncbi:DUF2802 domain-containing protein [Alteromonas pelagimontana]|nr:DUF2802 domain-containing protein [Alteromonas pelagimontana]
MDVTTLTYIAIGLAGVALLLCIILAISLRGVSNSLLTVKEEQQIQRNAIGDEIAHLSHQINEEQARSLVQGKHLQQLQEQLVQLENQLREVKQQDPSMRLYSRATELVKQGASIAEIMQACDLPRAEAELLISMHRKNDRNV